MAPSINHTGAQSAYLVTTGNATPAAREWARDKPIVVWDWPYLVRHWPTEIAELANCTVAEASDAIRPGWYVYNDELDTPWAVKLPKSIGEHPLLGFRPLGDPNLEVLPKVLKMRHISISAYAANGRPTYRSLPVASKEQREVLWTLQCDSPPGVALTLELPTQDGSSATWTALLFQPGQQEMAQAVG